MTCGHSRQELRDPGGGGTGKKSPGTSANTHLCGASQTPEWEEGGLHRRVGCRGRRGRAQAPSPQVPLEPAPSSTSRLPAPRGGGAGWLPTQDLHLGPGLRPPETSQASLCPRPPGSMVSTTAASSHGAHSPSQVPTDASGATGTAPQARLPRRARPAMASTGGSASQMTTCSQSPRLLPRHSPLQNGAGWRVAAPPPAFFPFWHFKEAKKLFSSYDG